MKRYLVLVLLTVASLILWNSASQAAEDTILTTRTTFFSRVKSAVSSAKEGFSGIYRRIRGNGGSSAKTYVVSDLTVSNTANVSSSASSPLPSPVISQASVQSVTIDLSPLPMTSATLTPQETTSSPIIFAQAAQTTFTSLKSETSNLITEKNPGTLLQASNTTEVLGLTHAESAEGNSKTGNRATQQTTEKAAEGMTPSTEAGASVWIEESEKLHIDFEEAFAAISKLMRLTNTKQQVIEKFEHISSKALKILKYINVDEFLGLDDKIGDAQSFEERMGMELISRILGLRGPKKSLLFLLGPEGTAEAARFAISKIPLPGSVRVANTAALFIRKGFETLTCVSVNYHKMKPEDAINFSNLLGKEFKRVYGSILSQLDAADQNFITRLAVETAMFKIDRLQLEKPDAPLSPREIIAAIGTESFNPDARMPRAAILLRVLKSVFIKSSGLSTQEGKALLTSTPLKVEGSSMIVAPRQDPQDPRSLVTKLFWRGTLDKYNPVLVPDQFKHLSRNITIEELSDYGITVSPSELLLGAPSLSEEKNVSPSIAAVAA